MEKCCFATHFTTALGFGFFCVGFALEGVKGKLHCQLILVLHPGGCELCSSMQRTKCVNLGFSIGLNIFLCYASFALVVCKNFIAVPPGG